MILSDGRCLPSSPYMQSGVASLLYFLLDNMLSKSRLTPRRIKVWISLLCVVATWTLLSVYLLVCVQSLETVTQNAVHSLSDELVSGTNPYSEV